MKSKVYQSFSDFFRLPFKALQFGAYYFQLNIGNLANTQMYVHETNFSQKFAKKQWFEKSSKKRKILLKTAGIRNALIFAKPLIYESFLL